MKRLNLNDFTKGDRVIYHFPDNPYDGQVGTVTQVHVREMGQTILYTITFPNGHRITALPDRFDTVE